MKIKRHYFLLGLMLLSFFLPVFTLRILKTDKLSNPPFIISSDFQTTEENNAKIPQYSNLLFNNTNPNQKRAYFDMSHEQVFSIWDTGFMGYSELNILLQNYFLETSTITHSLSEYVKNMTSEDLLFLNVGKYAQYNSDEINNITAFVGRGGNLIILGEHPGFGFIEFQNPLLRSFGMEFLPLNLNDYYNNVFNTPSWITFNSSFFSLTNLTIFLGSSIDISSTNAFPIARSSFQANYPNKPIMAGYIHPNGKSGKVFCCSDTEWIWNGCNSSLGIRYGNNSRLFLKVLDWFYNAKLSLEIDAGFNVCPEYTFFTAPKNNIFKLNLTSNRVVNITTEIKGGLISPNFVQDAENKITFDINVSQDGYVRFIFNKTSTLENFSKTVYFFENNNLNNKILFIQDNYSRSVDPTPSGFMNLARQLRILNYSIYASQNHLNYSNFQCIFICNPLRKWDNQSIIELNLTDDNTRIVFLNSPFSSLYMEDLMADILKNKGFRPLEVPINQISLQYGINFSRYIVADSINNVGEKLYFPKILGVNSSFYNVSCYMTSIVNVSEGFVEELCGYEQSWGEYHTIFGTSGVMGEHQFDINNTCVLAHTNRILATGILNYFTNEFFVHSNYFNDFFFHWIDTGDNFSIKFQVTSNQTIFNFKDTRFKISSTDVIRDSNGDIVPNGTLFSVVVNKGRIITDDAAPSMSGFQISIFNGQLNLTCSSGDDDGIFEISIYNSTTFKIIISLDTIYLNFTTKPFLYDVTLDPRGNGTVFLNWKVHPEALTYYIFRAENIINDISSLTHIDNISTNFYQDNLTTFGTYYYVIVGSDFKRNTTHSNCILIVLNPLLEKITPNPTHEYFVNLSWTSLIDVKTYYIFKSKFLINNQNITSAEFIGNTSNLYYLDTNNLAQGETYYYIILGSNYLKNSTVSNCENITIQYIPLTPAFKALFFEYSESDFKISWDSVDYAIGYRIFFSSEKGFVSSEANFLLYTTVNYFWMRDANTGKYYIRIMSIGEYGNSSSSEEITIEVTIKNELMAVEPDDPLPLLILIGGFLTISTIVVFSYFWFFLKKHDREKIS